MLYFAYGSNLAPERLQNRVGSLQHHGVARLDGYRLTFDKRGRDGSGKANLQEDALGSVWGVVYAFEPEGWRELDRFEAGYERIEVEVELADPIRVQTYRSSRLCSALPFAWYKQHVVEGARHHRLPLHWISWLEEVQSQPDPSCGI